MTDLYDWFFRGLGLSVLTGLIYYVFGLFFGYEPTWTQLEVFITLFGTGFLIAAFIYVAHSIHIEGPISD